MKNCFPIFLAVFVIGILMVSCQSEYSQSRQSAQGLSKDSPLTQKISDLTANNTAIDNTIDSTDCFSVKLPVNLIVNGTIPVTVSNAQGYETVAALLQNTPTGNGTVDFVFPIQLVSAAYEVTTVNSGQEFEAAVSGCTPHETVGCLQISYPITVTAYDAATQNPSIKTIDNNEEFFLMLLNLPEEALYEIRYPIEIRDNLGTIVTVNSNTEFDQAFANAASQCACDNPHILTDDLILYIPVANEIADLTGFTVPEIIGPAVFSVDPGGNDLGAVVFLTGASDNRIFLPETPENDMLQDDEFTVSLWFRREDLNIQDMPEILFEAGQMKIMLYSQFLEIRTPRVEVNGQAIFDQAWIDEGLLGGIGTWYHLAVTYQNNMLRLYRNATLEAEMQIDLEGPMSPAFIGGSFPNGSIDQVRVYKRALNGFEIGLLTEMPSDNNTCL